MVFIRDVMCLNELRVGVWWFLRNGVAKWSRFNGWMIKETHCHHSPALMPANCHSLSHTQTHSLASAKYSAPTPFVFFYLRVIMYVQLSIYKNDQRHTSLVFAIIISSTFSSVHRVSFSLSRFVVQKISLFFPFLEHTYTHKISSNPSQLQRVTLFNCSTSQAIEIMKASNEPKWNPRSF